MFADKLTRIGQAQALVQSWIHVVDLKSDLTVNHTLFQSLPESCHEQILLQLASERAPSSLSTKQALCLPKYRLLAQVPYSLCASKHFQYVVTHKLLLRKPIDDFIFWRVLIDAMMQTDCEPLKKPLASVFDVVLARWSQDDFAVNTEYTVNASVCFFLRYSLQQLTESDGGAAFMQQDWVTKLCKGVQDHMSHSLERVRALGMRVGESLSHVIASENPLDFGLESEDPLVEYGCPVLPGDIEAGTKRLHLDDTSTDDEAQISSGTKSSNKSRDRQKSVKKRSLKPFVLDPDELVDSDHDDDDEAGAFDAENEFESSFDGDDSDSDMSLEAYDLQDNEEDLTAKRPVYLKDLIAGLLVDDDREKTEAALSAAESLLRRQPRDLNDKAPEVVRALLRLEDKYNTPQFTKLRSQALASACALAPTSTLPYLCSQALEREQLLQSRIDALQAMTSAAQELSERGGGYQRSQSPKTLLQEKVDNSSSDLSRRTMQRLKTRRWGYRRDPLAVPKRNAFAPYALEFFSPLLFGYVDYVRKHSAEPGKPRSEVEQTFLAHLLHALASVVECAGHAPQSLAMGKCLLEFAWRERSNSSAEVHSPVSSANLSALGKALDQASISTSPAAPHEASRAMDVDAAEPPRAQLPAKSPKKRVRTDSMKKMLPAPASQRPKQLAGSPQSQQGSGAEDDAPPPAPQRSHAQPAKLMVKDRRGCGMGVPRAHLILNAVNQAPPAKEKSNPRRWSKHEDESLRLAVERSGERNWKAIADQVPGRNHTQCLQRWTKVLKPGLIKVGQTWRRLDWGVLWQVEGFQSRANRFCDPGPSNAESDGVTTWTQTSIRGKSTEELLLSKHWMHSSPCPLFPSHRSYTEDEDKIIVEMQAKLAASKEEKTTAVVSASPASDTVSTASSSPADVERPKPKLSKASPTQQKIPVADAEPDSNVKVEIAAAPETKAITDATTPGTSVGNMPSTVFVKNTQVLSSASQSDIVAAMGVSGTPHNVNDLVAASIHNFQMSQRFHPNPGAHAGNALYPGNPNQLITGIAPGNQQPASSVYAMADGGVGAFNVNIQPQQMSLQQHQHIQPQQVPSSYQYPPGFAMQQNMAMMHNYVVPTSFPTSSQMHMQMQMSMPMPVSSSMQQSLSMPPAPTTYSSQAMAIAMANAQYQPHHQHPPAVHQGFSGAPLHPRVVSMGTPSGPATQHMVVPTTNAGVASSSINNANGGPNGMNGSNAGLPPSSAAAAGGKGLNTPREEWGSSQTPRSQMIMTEGHASAYELFHQQRLRLMLQERDKQGMTLSSAPSPGQALLTKELEANKERQARQAIMQKGWKSAVESMVSFNSVSVRAGLLRG
ncbi:unnamed protein product [Phytophthora fragariaefolia]|uniref:Unnamed protein product n=1 Tax=Phytophthora fragariaefolia TaxID=1490495 RepID=A0A9W6XBV6_9STRA|nr:unnamed protein product [Phytophthora fragariaefolia]